VTRQPDSSTERQKLLDSLWEDARREGQHMIRDARQKAHKMTADADALRREVVEEALGLTEAESAPHLARILNRARLEAESIILEERSLLLESCLEEAGRRLTEDKAVLERARKALPLMLEATLNGFGELPDARVLVANHDLAAARKAVSSMGLKVRVEADSNMSGGAQVVADGGRRVLDNTVRTRLAGILAQPPLELYRLLFDGSGTRGDPLE
jgi:vacuolar-type H+-ATPase subunit E/Vma4